jgi:methionyl-tRNA formyltransferase
MTLRVALIGCDSMRARAYAKVLLARSDLTLQGIFYGEGEGVDTIFAVHQRPYLRVAASGINAHVVANALSESEVDFAIFAGNPGEIVAPAILSLGIPLLHMHPGALPAFRGSTVIYYSILAQQPITVSAILLAECIDCGPVLHTRNFAYPRADDDIDGAFDATIRAETLAELLDLTVRNGTLPAPQNSDSSKGMDYFIIHPVLKHIARLSLEAERG